MSEWLYAFNPSICLHGVHRDSSTYYPRLGLKNLSLPLRFRTTFCYFVCIYLTYACNIPHLSHISIIILIVSGEEKILYSFPLYSFSPSYCHFCLAITHAGQAIWSFSYVFTATLPPGQLSMTRLASACRQARPSAPSGHDVTFGGRSSCPPNTECVWKFEICTAQICWNSNRISVY